MAEFELSCINGDHSYIGATIESCVVHGQVLNLWLYANNSSSARWMVNYIPANNQKMRELNWYAVSTFFNKWSHQLLPEITGPKIYVDTDAIPQATSTAASTSKGLIAALKSKGLRKGADKTLDRETLD